MSFYQVDGKIAIVTGGGSGICHALTKLLLEAGCSVMIADLRLRPEAEDTVNAYPHPPAEPGRPSAVFHRTDVSDWTHLTSLWEAALQTFGRVDIVVNGAGMFEPPSSAFWHPPRISKFSRDPADSTVGQYKTFAVNAVGPIRLAQIALDYWMENRHVEGNLMWISSMAGYTHRMMMPLYYASKAAVVNFVKCLGSLRRILGIRNSCVCPGAVFTPLFDHDHCRGMLRKEDVALTPGQCAAVIMRVLREPQYGDGNIVETRLDSFDAEPLVREVPLEAPYPAGGPLQQIENVMAAEDKMKQELQLHGMRGSAS
ncbi:hypothetical protein DL762_009554 [Monosporascus cannonballus]|uniref:NAD-dependent epimerase/dehydratase domain-containing protein n=1 Tax=Monosporascus cannonballus TaxID=155416 RepID=A0ABY0GT03_9PEZI|nr:hypothetical protein DL762_009554 [Monosporascus cannonballus]